MIDVDASAIDVGRKRAHKQRRWPRPARAHQVDSERSGALHRNDFVKLSLPIISQYRAVVTGVELLPELLAFGFRLLQRQYMRRPAALRTSLAQRFNGCLLPVKTQN